ncbi:MAG TPA: cadmium resistance transporter [Acidimicrobiia bacterium]|nr:cadmium resistance transporter [Acidimicrobiia bacterium]
MATVLLAVGLYATTNIDNFVVLTAFYADRSYRPRAVTVGTYLGLGVIVAISAGAAAAAADVPHRYIGLLGFVPLTLGVLRLVTLAREVREGLPADPDTPAHDARHGPVVVAAVTVGNGGDNIAAYIPVFASRSLGTSSLIVAVFVAAAGVWCVAAYTVAHARWGGRSIERVSHVVVPLVYLGLGVWILVLSGTLDWLVGSS